MKLFAKPFFMKNPFIFTVLLLSCIFGQVFAGDVKEDKARIAAQNWYRHHAPEGKKSASITKAIPYQWNERTSFYICSFDKGGFVLVSANDAVTPILGYGFDHPAPGEITNEAVKGWFDNYARQIDTAFVLNLKNKEMAAKWQEVLSNKLPAKNGNSVGPLLTTTWDQGWPYNAMCPEDPNGPGGHTVVGCVGVALAQIFKYHNYPERGIGEYSYNLCNYGTVTAKFDSIDYEWIDMPNIINQPNQNIAKICSDAAISVASNFGAYNTSVTWIDGATPRNPVEPAMISFFDYAFSELSFLKRINYIDPEWKDIISQEINLNRPTYYRADDENGTVGHAWVIDGYDSNNFFHCNWGWNGSYNGFFILEELIAGGYSFNTDQMLLIGIKPNDGSSINKTVTWTGDTSINHKIAIGNSAILNLDPGTKLRFAENSHVEVWGTIKSNGTINDSVYFMAIDNAKGWNGIKFERGYNLPGFFAENDTSTFQNTVIEYSIKTACYINFFNKVKFEGCNIRNNSNLDFLLQWAGGIHSIESDVNIKNSIFLNNIADFGGGISILLSISNNQITIYNNQFINNSANYCGGGLKLQVDNSNGLISNNIFLNNYAGRGGGAYLYATNSKLINNTFKYNHGEWTGGGVYIDGNDYGETTLFQNQIISNTGGMGPGIHIWLSNPKIINNLISDNLVTLYGSANPEFINNTFFQSGFYNRDGNISRNANILEIYDTTCHPYFFSNLIPGGKEGFIGAGAGNAYDTTRFINNIDVNPKFKDPENFDYHLLFSSPLINSGITDSILLDLPPYDFDGNARITNDTIDVGIYEFCGPRKLGIITGNTIVCKGQSSITYIVPTATDATSYLWTLPPGATGNSLSNSITVNFGAEANSGEISVKGVNDCGEGEASSLFVQVNETPSQPSPITGNTAPQIGSNEVYSVIYSEGISYEWTVPEGSTITDGQGTHMVTIIAGGNAGTITTTPSNECGNGMPSSLEIQAVCSSNWSPPSNLQFNMQLVAQIRIDGQVSLNPNDVLGAFVGDECRGIASPDPALDGIIFLTIGSNEGINEQIELKIWNSSNCSECNAIPGFAFVNQGEIGTFLEPYQVRCGAIQDITFGQGYTWFSLNVNPGNMSPASLFSTLTPCYDDRVIGQTSFALFTGSAWVGSLTNLGMDKMYRMKLCSQQSMSLMGDAALLSPISLSNGYTWLGYSPQECLPINQALANMSPSPSYDDRLIGQSSFALFTGSQWVGTLSTLCPNEGYVIRLASASNLKWPGNQSGSEFNCGSSTITDIDNNNYKTIVIGNQCWMKENLKTTKNPSGVTILRHCYNDDEEKCNQYGGLYDWLTAINGEEGSNSNPSGVQGICPDGWHLPSDEEWGQMVDYMISQGFPNDPFSDSGISNALRSCRQEGSTHSDSCNTTEHPRWDSGSRIGFDQYGFSAFPGGFRWPEGWYVFGHYGAYWWSSSKVSATDILYRSLYNYYSDIYRDNTGMDLSMSVRCVKDVVSSVSFPSLSTQPIDEITSASASCGGIITDDGGDEIIARGVVWNTSPNPTIMQNSGITSDGIGLGTFSSLLTELEENTIYFVRSYATNSRGTSYGEEISFSTTLDSLTGQPCAGIPIVYDFDGNAYNTVYLNKRCWLKENLKTTHYKNGNPINYPGTNTLEWMQNSTGAYAWYNNDISWKDSYGALYNWYAIENTDGICPEGWHVPDDYDLYQLTTYGGGDYTNVGGKYKSTRTAPASHPRWESPNTGATDYYNFSAIPGGYRDNNAFFSEIGYKGYLWTSSTADWEPSKAFFYRFQFNEIDMGRQVVLKTLGLSLRCVKD